MTKIGNIRKWVKDKAGVSPIIAIILMVAITVVLAATIYVWVSGMGKGGTSAPSMSATADQINHKLIVSQADKGLTWDKVTVSYTYSGVTNVNISLYNIYGEHNYAISSGSSAAPNTWTHLDVSGGDYFTVDATGSGSVSITLVYTPTNTNLGTWTFYF